MLTFILLLAAFIAFLLATIPVAVPRINLIALGLTLVTLVALIGAWP
jgi:hypothetical protein